MAVNGYDLRTAGREFAAEPDPNFDAACFHAQQCAEKYLKAVLQEREAAFGKTHDLLTLLDTLGPSNPSFADIREVVDELTDYAVDLRYPGDSADRDRAERAVETARRSRLQGVRTGAREVRRRARLLLGLEA